jgi:hypothetical protein
MNLVCDSLPPTNRIISCYLYCLEVGLRELLIEVLSTTYGAKWWKQRLPGSVLESYRKGRKYEQGIKWSQCIPHHPMYYTDFPDLRQVIEQSDNWKDVFQPIFADKDVFIGMLRELEPIRNKIAHNRKSSEGDLKIVEAVYQAITSAVGENRLSALVTRCTAAPDIREHMLRLHSEAVETYANCAIFAEVKTFPHWASVRDSWWFDNDYLGHQVSEITTFFKRIEDYCDLPRVRGNGHKIEAWVRTNLPECVYSAAINELTSILDVIGGA